jgi:predicted SAM-dependent methyltransferase
VVQPEYVNVDMRELQGVDVLAEAGALPFEPGTVDEVSSEHLVEHFPQEDLRRRVLSHWYSLIKPGGRLRAITPDGEAMLTGLAQGNYAFDDFREVLFGSQDYDGDFHFNLFTPDTLRRLVEEAGFTAVEIPVRGRRNGQCFEFELVAQVPAASSR